MIKHIVMIKFKQPTEENLNKAKQMLIALEGKVPELISMEVGIDVLRSERSYDLVLTAEFDSLDDLAAYQVHPAHQEVIEYINTVKEVSIAVDYEI